MSISALFLYSLPILRWHCAISTSTLRSYSRRRKESCALSERMTFPTEEDKLSSLGNLFFQGWSVFGNLTNRGGGVGGCSDFLPKKCEIATEETANSSEL